jgi:hypothetical protein
MLQGWIEFQAMNRGSNLMMHQWTKDRSDV